MSLFFLKIHHRDPSGSWVYRMIDPFIQFMDQLIELMIIEKSVISIEFIEQFHRSFYFCFCLRPCSKYRVVP